MIQFIAHNTQVNAVQVPASKSYAQRVILAATLSKKETKISGIGRSEDVVNILKIGEQLGAQIEYLEEHNTAPKSVKITGFVNQPKRELNAGESGLGIRLTTSICAVLAGDFQLTGKGSLLSRSMAEFENYLPQIGIECQTNNGFLPLSLKGKAIGGPIQLDGSISSQYLSGLLMALPLLPESSTIYVENLKSKPYIDITLAVLARFGIEIKHEAYQKFNIQGNQTYVCNSEYLVEGDYSGASIWMVHGALNSGIQIKGLHEKTVQGDAAMLLALEKSKVKFHWKEASLHIEKSTVQPFKFDANECPDLFPALVVLAAAAIGTSEIQGVKRLLHKESNRALVLQKEFAELGLKIDLIDDTMYIQGTGSLLSGEISSNNDHRIAMAGAIAASLTKDGIKITESESVAKSYPEFWLEFDKHNALGH